MKNFLKKSISMILIASVCISVCLFASAHNTVYAEAKEEALILDVKTTFDSKTYKYPILHIDEYPAMSVENLAKVIGGTSFENTITVGDKSITFTPYSRLAEDSDGHIMLERTPVLCGGELYVPVSFIKPYFKFNMHYDRFGKTLSITSGNNYPKKIKKTFYVKDYGAVGDGITYDGQAITSALNDAINSGVTSKVELEAGKTYLIEERMDSWSFFTIEDTDNLTFEGNGSTILFEKPTNSFIALKKCNNVKIQNLNIDYKELCATQGRILSVDKENGMFTLQIDEGFPLPADDEWVHYYNRDERSGGWWFGQLYDSDEDRMKYTGVDNLFVDSITPNDAENRIYDVYIRGGKDGNIKWAEVSDRFVINTRHSAYEIGDSIIKTEDDGTVSASDGAWKMLGSTSSIWLDKCADCLFDGVYIYSTGWMFCGIGFSEGKTTFKNSGFKIKEDGRLLCANSDGIHTWFNRGALVLENCTFMNNLDDHINTYTQGGFVSKIINERTFETVADLNGKIGDEIQVYNQNTKELLGRAFIEGYEKIQGSNGRIVTLDRDFADIESLETTETPSILYNMDSGSRGNSISGCNFINSRRYAVLNRAANSIFENNIISGCGAGIAAMNELTKQTKSEGGFPDSMTIRNNTVSGNGNTYGYYPLEVRHWNSKNDSSRAIDGMLIENNEFNVPNNLGAMYINSVNDLYLINNKIIGASKVRTATLPVKIENCSIGKIDGLTLEYSSDVTSAMDLIACNVDENDISDIKGNAKEKYRILAYGSKNENFESTNTDIFGEYMTAYQSKAETYNDLVTRIIPRTDAEGGNALELIRSEDSSFKDEYDNLILRVNLQDEDYLLYNKGKLTYEFDWYAEVGKSIRTDFVDIKKKKENILRLSSKKDDEFVKAEMKANDGNFIEIGSVSANVWHSFRIILNYEMQRIEYYADNNMLSYITFEQAGFTPESYIRVIEHVAWNKSGCGYVFDNINIFYEEPLETEKIKIREFSANKLSENVLKITLVASAKENTGAELYTAFYDNDVLVHLEKESLTFETKEKYFTLKFGLPNNIKSDMAKIFVWTSDGKLEPLAVCKKTDY